MRVTIGVRVRLGLGLERDAHHPKKPDGPSGGDGGGGKAGERSEVSITRSETDSTSCSKARLIFCGSRMVSIDA